MAQHEPNEDAIRALSNKSYTEIHRRIVALETVLGELVQHFNPDFPVNRVPPFTLWDRAAAVLAGADLENAKLSR